MSVSPGFARVLAAGRASFNTQVAQAKRRTPSFDSEAFLAFLTHAVDPVVAAVEEVAAAHTASVVAAAYEMAMTLTAQACVVVKRPQSLLVQTWVCLLPALAKQVAQAPKHVLGMLSNAALYIERSPHLRGQEWLQHMCALAPSANVPELLSLGQVLAWRAGAAHFRSGALRAADNLPEHLALAAVGASNRSWAAVRAAFDANPWWAPHADAPMQRRIGGFTGLGGSFAAPPTLRASANGFWVKSADHYSLLVADVWGAVLQPAQAHEFVHMAPEPKQPLPELHGSQLVWPHRSHALDWPAEGLTLVCNDTTAALSSAYSHHIALFPLR